VSIIIRSMTVRISR